MTIIATFLVTCMAIFLICLAIVGWDIFMQYKGDKP